MPDWNALTGAGGVFRDTDVALIYRSTLVSALGVAIAGLCLLALAGYPLVGAGLVAGLLTGAASSRAFQSSTSRIVASPGTRPRRQIGSRTLARLGVITVVVLVLLVVVPQFGAGALCGVAAFQMLLLAHTARRLLKQKKVA
jgi:hypothetical protein